MINKERIKEKLNTVDFKKMNIKNLKVFQSVFAIVLPYVLGTAGLNYLMEKTNTVPLTVDKVKYYENTMNYFNSDGYEVENITYGTNNGQKSELVVTNKWERNEKGEYVQKKETYKIKDNINIDKLYEIVSNKDEMLLKPVLGNPIGTELSVQQEVSKEERLKPSLYEATVNRENKDEYIYGPESKSRNFSTSFFWICTQISLSILYANSKYVNNKLDNIGKVISDYDKEKREEKERNLIRYRYKRF